MLIEDEQGKDEYKGEEKESKKTTQWRKTRTKRRAEKIKSCETMQDKRIKDIKDT